MAAAKTPVNSSSGRIDGERTGSTSDVGVAHEQRDDGRADDGDAQHHGHRLLRGDRRVAVAADDHEDGLAQRGAERQAEPERVEPDAGRRVELRGDDGHHAGERQRRARRRAGGRGGRDPSAAFASATIAGYV